MTNDGKKQRKKEEGKKGKTGDGRPETRGQRVAEPLGLGRIVGQGFSLAK